MDPTALHTWQAPGIRPGSGPAGDAGPSPGDCSGQPQTGSGGWRSHGLQAPIRADVREGRRQGDRHAPAELEKWQACRPVDRNPAGLCIPEDWPEAGRLDPLGRCHGRPAPDLELQAPDGTVMKWAIAQGYRLDNPAGEAIGAALPKLGGIQRHHRALPYGEVASAIRTVRQSETVVAVKLAFEFLVLTACRSGEVRGARWEEVDLEAEEWRIPPEKMKHKREHRVPLSSRAREILVEAKQNTLLSEWVFPSPTGRALSDSVFNTLLWELGIPAVPHGFRSSFRDWAAECTDAPHAVMEAALSHVVRNQVEAAYARSDLFERRRVLMEQWAKFLAGGNREPKVVPILP